MHFVGIFLYISSVIVSVSFEASRTFFLTTYALAPEIMILIIIGYFYPLMVFVFAYFSGQQKNSKAFFQSQAFLASTLCVSLGLIGTFFGLSEMVASISAGMNAEGDFNVKISSLLDSIGSSLDAMSLAFLTSILGVAASVLILVSCNYLALYFKDKEVSAGTIGAYGVTYSESSSMNAEDLSNAIHRSFSPIFSALSASVEGNNEVQRTLSNKLDDFMLKQSSRLNEGFDHMSTYAEKIIEQMTLSNTHLASLQTTYENSNSQYNAQTQDFHQQLSQIADFSSKIATDLKQEASSSEAVRALLENIDNSLRSLSSGVDQGLADANYISKQIVSEVSTSNDTLGALRQTFVTFDASYQTQITHLNTQFDNIDRNLRSFSTGVEQGIEDSKYLSNQIVSEVSSSNENLGALRQTFVTFDDSYQTQAARFNTLIDKHSQDTAALASVMQAIMILLAPPLYDALAQAITDNKLNIMFQPNINKEQEIIGCEVFVKWDDPVRGTVSNMDIFSLEMRNHAGLMVDLDKWVLTNSIYQLATWIKDGVWKKDSIMSINISESLLTDTSLISFLKAAITSNMVPPSYLAIEFNESSVSNSNFPNLKQTCKDIKDLGCNIYIDNYGSGHFSMVMYQQLYVHKLKIDRAIIKEFLDTKANGSILRSIIASSRELGIELMAEGVEDNTEKATLVENGISYFQGYCASAPLNSSDYYIYLNEFSEV
jgi:EAL domain-containing protein (putative c-di-GMP-specific phosphodiesterase class I)